LSERGCLKEERLVEYEKCFGEERYLIMYAGGDIFSLSVV